MNLIPYNRTDVKDKLYCPSEAHMAEFQRIVTSYGSFCSIRRTMGADIAGACGQLVVAKERENITKFEVLDIEDALLRGNNTNHSDKKIQKFKGRVNIRTDDQKGGDLSKRKQKLNYQKWVQPLTVATIIAGSCFILSATAMMVIRRKR